MSADRKANKDSWDFKVCRASVDHKVSKVSKVRKASQVSTAHLVHLANADRLV